MSDTIYCYPDSDVLINKLDIRELDKLHTFERKLTMLRLLELMDKPISGKFDFKHLQAIHGIRSIAFPSISTGVYCFPVELAAKIAVKTVSRFLDDNPDSFEVVEWVLFDNETERIYEGEVDKLYTDL